LLTPLIGQNYIEITDKKAPAEVVILPSFYILQHFKSSHS